jgi:hypothetical protein
MARHLRILALALAAHAAPLAAQPLELTTYARPPREDGALIFTATAREAPASERALVAATGERVETVGPPRWSLGAFAWALVTGFGVALTLQATRAKAAPAAPRPAPRAQPAAHPGVELRCVTVAFDASLRTSVERAVRDAGGEPYATLSALRDALARAHGAIRAASMQTRSVDPASAPTAYDALAASTRARAAAAQGEHGDDGVAVVALVAAIRGPLPALPPRVDAASVLTALDALVPPRPDKVAAAEVVWAPGALSHAAAGAAFPDLVALAASR